jgi:dethiobiotin synthetase
MRGIFVTGTGTDVGKTFVTRGLATALRGQGRRVVALKPIETGYGEPERSDAHALAIACGRPELRDFAGFYRARAALAPLAATLEGEKPVPPIPALVDAVHLAARGAELTLVEGAGGVLVPLDLEHTQGDLIAALGLPLLLVAPNVLGVLSHVLTAAAAITAKRLELRAVVLVDPIQRDADPSTRTNARILDERLGAPVFELERAENDNEALARAVTMSGLPTALLDAR